MNKTLLKLSALAVTFSMTSCSLLEKEVYSVGDFKPADKAKVLDVFVSKTAPDKPEFLVVELDTDKDNVPDYVAGLSCPTPAEKQAIFKTVKKGSRLPLQQLAEIFHEIRSVNVIGE